MSSQQPTPEHFVKPRHFEVRMSLLFGALFVSLGIHLPYFPLWLEAKGFDAEQIAVILAVPMFVRIITTPLITAMADRTRDRANVLLVLCVASLLVSLGYFLEPSYAVVLLVSVLLAVFWTPQSPLGDSLALSGVRRFGSSYPGMRIWGSITYLAGSLVGGLVLAATSPEVLPTLISLGLLLALLAAFLTPRMGPPRRASMLSPAALHAVGPKLFSRYFVLFIAGVGIINGSHGFMFAFASIYWKGIGVSDAMMGVLWTWAVVAEVGIFLVFNRIFGSTRPTVVLAIAGIAAVVRWLVYPLVEPAGLGIAGFFFVQTLHALSTGMLLIGLQKMIGETVAEERTGAAQGAAFFSIGFSMAVVTLVSGPLYERLGVDGFYVMALVALAGLGLIVAASFTPTALGRGETPKSHGS